MVLVLAWATLITLVGRHPKLSRYSTLAVCDHTDMSRYNIYVTMFYKILETFVTFLIWYSFFLIAFALGFYIMLHKVIPLSQERTSNIVSRTFPRLQVTQKKLERKSTSSLTTPGFPLSRHPLCL